MEPASLAGKLPTCPYSPPHDLLLPSTGPHWLPLHLVTMISKLVAPGGLTHHRASPWPIGGPAMADVTAAMGSHEPDQLPGRWTPRSLFPSVTFSLRTPRS